MSYPATVLITGANRGIGLGLTRELLKSKEVKHLFATARNPDHATALMSISDPRLQVVKMDVEDDSSIAAAFDQVSQVVGNEGLNLLINNAGVMAETPINGKPSREAHHHMLNINSTSALIVSQIFLPLVRKAAVPNEWGVHRAAIVSISSGLGSIQSSDGSEYRNCMAYRMSKAALNMAMKTLAVDLESEGILCASVAPGWVQTDMGGKNAAITVDESAGSIVRKCLQKLDKTSTGGFFDKDGAVLPF